LHNSNFYLLPFWALVSKYLGEEGPSVEREASEFYFTGYY